MGKINSALLGAARAKHAYFDNEFAKAVRKFITKGDRSIFQNLPDLDTRGNGVSSVILETLASYSHSWDEENDTAVRFKLELWQASDNPRYKALAVRALGIDANSLYFLSIKEEFDHLAQFIDGLKGVGMDDATITRVLTIKTNDGGGGLLNDFWFLSTLESEPHWRTEMETFLWQLPDKEFVEAALTVRRGYHHFWDSMVRFRPHCIRSIIDLIRQPNALQYDTTVHLWEQAIRATGDYDEEALGWAREYGGYSGNAEKIIMKYLVQIRPEIHLDQYVEFLGANSRADKSHAFHTLADHAPRQVLYTAMKQHLAAGRCDGFKCYAGPNVLAMAVEDMFGDAREFFDLFCDEKSPPPYSDDLALIAKHAPPEADEMVYQLATKAFKTAAIESKDDERHLWAWVERLGWCWFALDSRPSVGRRFKETFVTALSNVRKDSTGETLRSRAKRRLRIHFGPSGLKEIIDELWESGDSGKKLIAIRTLGDNPTDEEKEQLQLWLASNPPKKYADVIQDVLKRQEGI